MNVQEIINKLISENKKDYNDFLEVKTLLEPYKWKAINGVTFKKFDYSKGSWYPLIKHNWKDRILWEYWEVFDMIIFTTRNTAYSTGTLERIRKLEMIDIQVLQELYDKIEFLSSELKYVIDVNEHMINTYDNPASYEIFKEYAKVIDSLNG